MGLRSNPARKIFQMKLDVLIHARRLASDTRGAEIAEAAAVLPLTHVVTLLQAAWNGDALTAGPWTIVALGLTTSVASTVAVWSFRWE